MPMRIAQTTFRWRWERSKSPLDGVLWTRHPGDRNGRLLRDNGKRTQFKASWSWWWLPFSTVDSRRFDNNGSSPHRNHQLENATIMMTDNYHCLAGLFMNDLQPPSSQPMCECDNASVALYLACTTTLWIMKILFSFLSLSDIRFAQQAQTIRFTNPE